MAERHADAAPVAAELADWGEARAWAGPDPYDGLNATRVPRALTRSRFGRRVAIQAIKRSPLDLRGLLAVPPARSAAGLAQVASAYAVGGFLDEDVERTRLDRALAALHELRCTEFSEPCWGYHFDVQTRVFFYPRGAPNTIATAFAGRAFLDAHARTGEERHLATAEAVCEFFLRHVPMTRDRDGSYFGYLVGDTTPIHNSSMLTCALLAETGSRTGRSDLLSAAEEGVAWTIHRQRPDGSWPYGEMAHLQWVDNFHTGYVLECLQRCGEAGVNVDFTPVLRKGLAYYRSELFLGDGTPKYMPASVYPIDGQCVAQAIQTFALTGDSDHTDFARTVLQFALRTMRRPDGAFYFQRRRFWINRTAHARWVQAPVLAALAHLVRAADRTA